MLVCACMVAACWSSAVDIPFAPGDYDNTANTVIAGPTPVNNQTTGNFRDVIWWSINNGQPRLGSPDFINQGNSLYLPLNTVSAVTRPAGDPLAYNALNFTGPSISGGQSYLSIYDTTPADGTATRNLFDAAAQTLRVSADVLFVVHNTSGGVVALYNEGQDGLALLANNGSGNNLDRAKLSLVWQSTGQGLLLDSVTLPYTTFVREDWYRVTMDLTVAGDTWTMNGSFQNHLIGTDPTSPLGSVITTMLYSGSLSTPGNPGGALTNPGEVGIMAMANEGISLPDNVGISVTDFHVEVPEPSTLSLLGLGALALVVRRRASAGFRREIFSVTIVSRYE